MIPKEKNTRTSKFSKVIAYKVNTQSKLCFYTLTMTNLEKKTIIPFIMAWKT